MLQYRLSLISGLMALTLSSSTPLMAQSQSQMPNGSEFDGFAPPHPSMMAQRPNGGGFPGEEGQRRGQFLEELNLTTEQRNELQSIRQRYRQEMEPIKTQLRTQQEELRDLLAGNASENTIRTKHSQVSSLRQELGNLHFESMLESRQVLSERQRQQLAELMEEHHQQRRQGRRGNFRPGGYNQ